MESSRFPLFAAMLIFSSDASATAIDGQGTWQSTLEPRDFDGNAATIEGYYDTALGITWLADANLPMTLGIGVNGQATGGVMSWNDAISFVDSLDVDGLSGWRLPNMAPTRGCIGPTYSGVNCGYNVDPASGEMAHMFYSTLGNAAQFDASGNLRYIGSIDQNSGPFLNIATAGYWYGTETGPNLSGAWFFNMGSGQQAGEGKLAENFRVWAVHDGDIGAPVPEPTTAVLLCVGLAGLMIRRRRRDACAWRRVAPLAARIS